MSTEKILIGIGNLQVYLEQLRIKVQSSNGRGLKEAEHGLYLLGVKANSLACKARDSYYPELLATTVVIPVEAC